MSYDRDKIKKVALKAIVIISLLIVRKFVMAICEKVNSGTGKTFVLRELRILFFE